MKSLLISLRRKIKNSVPKDQIIVNRISNIESRTFSLSDLYIKELPVVCIGSSNDAVNTSALAFFISLKNFYKSEMIFISEKRSFIENLGIFDKHFVFNFNSVNKYPARFKKYIAVMQKIPLCLSFVIDDEMSNYMKYAYTFLNSKVRVGIDESSMSKILSLKVHIDNPDNYMGLKLIKLLDKLGIPLNYDSFVKNLVSESEKISTGNKPYLGIDVSRDFAGCRIEDETLAKIISAAENKFSVVLFYPDKTSPKRSVFKEYVLSLHKKEIGLQLAYLEKVSLFISTATPFYEIFPLINKERNILLLHHENYKNSDKFCFYTKNQTITSSDIHIPDMVSDIET